ncbi:MAG: zinc ribbon domain-containing protein [Clostridia bacterium]|nr:zinc ribbon domain-containing protein [Clostridia bacterium]
MPKYCTHCGNEVNENAVVCVKCGCSIKPVNQVAEVNDTVSVGLVILAVLIPLFGIIYWPVKAKTRPKCAKACGIAAIVSWVVCFLFMMLAGGY